MSIQNSTKKMGRLSRDATFSTFSGNKGVINLSLAVDRPFSKETDFFRAVLWVTGGKETIEQIITKRANYFKKGRELLIEGYDTIKKYTSNNVKYQVSEIVVQEYKFLDKKNLSTVSDNNPVELEQENEQLEQQGFQGLDEDEDEDIPY